MRKYLEIFVRNLKHRLESSNMRPARLAELSDVPAPNISRILAGNANPSLEMITQLAAGLGCEPWELLRDPNQIQTESKSWFQLIDGMAKLQVELEAATSKYKPIPDEILTLWEISTPEQRSKLRTLLISEAARMKLEEARAKVGLGPQSIAPKRKFEK